MSQARTAIAVVVLVVVIGVVSLAGMAILSQVGGVALEMGISAGSEEIRDFGVGESIELDRSIDEEPSMLEVRATRENAVSFSGDGYVEGGVADGWDAGNWSVCSTQRLDEDANTQATRTVFAYDNETILLEYADEKWKGYHYGNDLSAETSINVTDPHEFDSVCLGWNDEELELTLSNAVEQNSAYRDSNAPDRQVAHDWFGEIDETRILNEPPDESRTSTYASDPVNPLGSAQHEARWMFNEGEGETTHVYYSDRESTIVNGDWGDGVEGPELERGTDYNVTFAPFEITILSGGYLEDAPTAFVDWDSGVGAMLFNIVSGTGNAMQLIPIIMLVMLAAIVVVVIQRMNQ